MEGILISVIIPVFNSEKTIEIVVSKLIENYSGKYNLEIILINDYSKDHSFNVCKNIAISDKRIKLINLSKNFGQHSAIMAGLNFCKGDFIVLMDDDMQNPPDEVENLIEKINEGYDVVFAARKEYNQSIFRKLGSVVNNTMFDYVFNKDKNLVLSNFLIMKKFIASEIIKYDGPYPYIQGLILRTTKNITHIYAEHKKREIGKSNYSFIKLLKLWVNGFTNFSVKPLRIAIFLGSIFAAIGLLFSLYLIVQKIASPNIQLGWTSIMVAVLMLSGIQLVCIGMLGEYIGRIFIYQNKSPQYIIKDVYNFGDEK